MNEFHKDFNNETTSAVIDNRPLVVVVGANGFVGRNLVLALIKDGRYRIRAVVRDLNYLKIKDDSLEVVLGDVTFIASIKNFLKGAEVVFYLVHMLQSRAGSLYANEAKVAENFGSIAKTYAVRRVVYLSGLGCDKQKLSRHLASRHNTGEILRKHLPVVIEFRAGIIVGRGSVSFEIIRQVINKLSIIVLPKLAKTLTQPIGLPDVLNYLIASISMPISGSQIIEIGGPDQLSYQDFLQAYANFLGEKRYIFSTAFFPLWLAGLCLYWFLPDRIALIGKNMVESFKNEMVVTNNLAREIFPDIIPKAVNDYFA